MDSEKGKPYDWTLDLAGQNNAILNFNAKDPINEKEALFIAGIDLDVWVPTDIKPNFWQMGRAKKTSSISWEDGVMSGYSKDTGKIEKTWLYQIKIWLTRKERIAVIPVIKPVNVRRGRKFKKGVVDYTKDIFRVLFITDPHFGYTTELYSKPEPFHSREFLSDLLLIADEEAPDATVWAGDTVDFAEFSKFPKKPAIIRKAQLAIIEAAWVINRFGESTLRTAMLEGNHDIRLPKAMIDNFAAAYELKPATDLFGYSPLSVPKLLGIDNDPTVEWVGDYPNGVYSIFDTDFEHGNKAPNVPGATVVAYGKERTRSLFFGHIHRHEELTKQVQGKEDPIFIGSPGCACRKEHVPGATRFVNWTIGAYLITFVGGKLLRAPEHIIHEKGETWFRGSRYNGPDYLPYFKASLPDGYREQF